MLTRRIRLLLTVCLLIVGALASPLGEGIALAHPTADFNWAPKPVVSGTPVTFISTSTPFHEPFTPITRAEWTIQGAGTFTGNQVTVTAPAAGPWSVRLHVWDAIGEDGQVTKVINVEPPPPPPPPPLPPPPPNQAPTPALAVLPASPLVGEEVTFVSYSEDADGRISEHAWDLNGDGTFDEVGAVVTGKFSTAGDRQVTLRVTDDKGTSATVSRTLQVRQPLAASAPAPSPPKAAPPLTPRLLSPFPVVRLIGSIVPEGAMIRMLLVRAPSGALVLVRCRGASCPVERVKRVAGKALLRFRALERQLDPGVVLEVFVRRGDRIGKYTRFEIRQNRFPKRADACLQPGTIQRVACPAR
jgi:PKD domain